MPNRGNYYDRRDPVHVETYGQRLPTAFGSDEIVPELIPQLVVPDLEGFQLKPYVAYNVPEVTQSEFTAEVGAGSRDVPLFSSDHIVVSRLATVIPGYFWRITVFVCFNFQNLFEAIYSEKIENDFKEGKLDEQGNSLEPSEEEQLGYEKAKASALSTGADLFCGFLDHKKGR